MISSAKDEGINIGVKKGAIENAIKVAEETYPEMSDFDVMKYLVGCGI